MMADSSDKMTFKQRVKSVMGNTLGPLLYPRMIINPENELFRKYIDPNFPDLRDISSKCPLVMVNSNELYDLPRPTLHKIVYVGGLGMTLESAKNLTG
uniref:glucuronosyltransferase n=1 Tax=Acrobeloides nanus TaxID=290746 RepID=A0A914DMW5_9BILA